MKKHPGHYCYVCGRRRANEKFSGKGHARPGGAFLLDNGEGSPEAGEIENNPTSPSSLQDKNDDAMPENPPSP